MLKMISFDYSIRKASIVFFKKKTIDRDPLGFSIVMTFHRKELTIKDTVRYPETIIAKKVIIHIVRVASSNNSKVLNIIISISMYNAFDTFYYYIFGSILTQESFLLQEAKIE